MDAKQKKKINQIRNAVEKLNESVKEAQAKVRKVETRTITLMNHLRDFDQFLKSLK